MNLFGLTDVGLVRKNNQDSYAIRVPDDELAIAVVCDGMGGARAGNVASAVAVESFSAALEQACKQGIPPDGDRKKELLRAACLSANSRIYELSNSNPEYEGMGTTLVAAMILSHEIYVVNIGDSRCYILADNELTQITTDHSLVQRLVDLGNITPEEARTHPKKNLITRAMGIDENVNCDLFQVDRPKDAVLLLCSDGLSNVVTDDTIRDVLLTENLAENAARTLMSLAIEQGAPDNVTIVLARL